ncbi:MAG: acyltransferase [Paludibacter sp.]
MKGNVLIEGDITCGMITIGFSDVGIFDFKRSKAIWNVSGRVIFKGRALIGQGSKISVEDTGELIFGENLKITAETSIVSLLKIEFGKNCLLSWDILIMDNDFHAIINKKNGIRFPQSKPIYIGDNVWIGCNTTILKGSHIPEHCIIGSNSTVNKKFEESYCLYAGNPLKVRKENVDWEF